MNNEAIKKIAENNGFDEASRQLFEEVGELIVSVNKYHRALKTHDIESAFIDKKKDDIAEEMSDVIVMIMELKHIIGIPNCVIHSIIEQKLNRQLERIEKNGVD